MVGIAPVLSQSGDTPGLPARLTAPGAGLCEYRRAKLRPALTGGAYPQSLHMPRKLSEWDLRTIAEVTSEMAKLRGAGFDAHAQALAFVRAAQVDAGFIGRLEEAARRIEARRGMRMPRKLFIPIASLFRDLEHEAEAVLSGWKASIAS